MKNITEQKVERFREYLENSINALSKLGENSFGDGVLFGYQTVLKSFKNTFDTDGEDDE